MKRSVQWSNSYEAQLSDEQLRWLHTALLARSPSDKEIREKLQPWKEGPRKGQKISLATLSNIRDRLELEENFSEDGRTTESLLEQLKSAVPTITDEELDAIGQRTFALLALRQRDLKSFVRLRSARTKAEIERTKLALLERAEARKDQELTLARDKFERETCELLLKAARDERVKEIEASAAPHEEKIRLLRAHYFADVDALEKAGGVELPP